ncbi:sensor histidine kinase [Nostoc sp.]|uniref:sensor histidine kinase n=1 Tax=Nostoc sp. TaxID=1180 RepID=UPI002FF844A5
MLPTQLVSSNNGSSHSPKPLNSLKLCRDKFSQWLNNLKVGQKITLGYTVVLGIAVVGTATGILISEHYQNLAYKQEKYSQEEINSLHRLQINILESRISQQKLNSLVQQPQEFQQEYTYLLKHLANLKQTWAEAKNFITTNSAIDGEHGQVLKHFIEANTGIVEEYVKGIEQTVEQIGLSKLKSTVAIEKGETLLFNFTNSPLALKLDSISSKLDKQVEVSSQELRTAKKDANKADILRLQIIAVSMLFSVAIASIIAISTNRLITHPLEATTRIAQQATLEENFDLQASVTTKDEVGILATSLNNLIQRVKQLLQEQEVKNQYLQHTLQELHKSQAQLIQSEKMSSLGQLVAGVAHEINNPVNFIHGNLGYAIEYAQDLLRLLQLYQQYYPNPPKEIQQEIEASDLNFISEDFIKLLKSMEIGTKRIREIVLLLRNFSRLDEAEFKKVDIHEGIESTLMILQNRLNAKPDSPAIEVIKNYGQLPDIECYPGQLNQVFMNLITNAIDALESEALLSNPIISIHTKVISDNWVAIHITDNASGIESKIAEKIFDPFFSTKPVGKGTGLGLSISYQIITKHAGELKCYSAPGEGAEFVIQIPIKHKDCATVDK